MTIPRYRPQWVEINREAVHWNVQQLRGCLPASTQLLAQVKCNAYGHGLLTMAAELVACGVEYFGVASLDEAAALRRAGFAQPILVQSALSPSVADAVAALNVWPTICTVEFARALQQVALTAERRIPVHLKIDTGMGRLGVWHTEALQFLQQLVACTGLVWEGCYTHLPSADEDPEYTRTQVQIFHRCVARLRTHGFPFPIVHSANSSAVLTVADAHNTHVRPGLMLYGVYPAPHMRSLVSLEPVMQWKSQIIFLKHAGPGRSISYGRSYVTTTDTTIATIPVGYGDGYPRILSGRSHVLVRGQRVPVIGRVCMDHMMLDVSTIPDIRIGDEVVLMGQQGAEQMTAETLAELADTISYEILTGVADRIPRLHVHTPILPNSHLSEVTPA